MDETEDNGLILGFADELIPNTSDSKGDKIPLLPVDFNDLGNRVWKLDFRVEGPVLSVNHDGKIEKIRELVIKDNKFLSLVYPEVIRQVAFAIASDKDFDYSDPGEGWESLWLKFFDERLGINYYPDPLNSNDIIVWCDEVSDSYSRKNNIITLLITK